jgi:hypothetical protein
VGLCRLVEKVIGQNSQYLPRLGSRVALRGEPGGPISTGSQWTHRWREGDANSRSRRERNGRGEGARSHRPLARGPELNTGTRSLFRDLPSATPGKPIRKSGTDGSNPLSSSSESGANLNFGDGSRKTLDIPRAGVVAASGGGAASGLSGREGSALAVQPEFGELSQKVEAAVQPSYRKWPIRVIFLSLMMVTSGRRGCGDLMGRSSCLFPAGEWRAIGIAAFLCYATAGLVEFRPSPCGMTALRSA